MKIPRVWTAAFRACADPARARRHWELLCQGPARERLLEARPEEARVWSALLAGSQVLALWLQQHPDWLDGLTPEALHRPRRRQGLETELQQRLASAPPDLAGALGEVRRFKQKEQLRIATRDLAGLAPLEEVIEELSDLAEVCLDTVWDRCWQEAVRRHGVPYQQEADGQWRPATACVLGMGKLGGRELNYSSDVDLLFVYSEEGWVCPQPPKGPHPPASRLTAHQFFNRLAELFIAEVTRLTPDGDLYRVDMRLRPEGEAGPLARSLPSYENYYAQWGQTWERMMLMKARPVAGDPELGADFLETVQPFRYPRSISPAVLEEVAALKLRIESEVLKPEQLHRHVKLGRGGIREIEFLVQVLQLLHAGRQPFLQQARTLPALEKLAQYELLPAETARNLAEAYRFLRQVEHRLQMEAHQQTHLLPDRAEDLKRLARLMGFDDGRTFVAAYQQHTKRVREIYDRWFGPTHVRQQSRPPFPDRFRGKESEWQALLARRGFRDPAQAVRRLQEFVEGPGFVHVSARTSELALRLVERLLERCPGGTRQTVHTSSAEPRLLTELPVLSDPDRVLTRLDTYVQAYGARATLYETWHSNPMLFDLLLLLFDRSEFLAEAAIRTPDLVEDQVLSGRLKRRRTAAEILQDLRHGRDDADQMAWLRKYHQAEQMRIGLRDILGLADPEQYLEELTALAEACLQYAVEVVMRKHRLSRPPFAVIGLGKLGGGEVDYGSDLDVLLVTSVPARDVTRCQKWAAEWMELLGTRTEHGLVFPMDARLRPDGEKGLLVNTLAAHEEYYRRRAQLWEIQALSRSRAVAGDLELGRVFESLVTALTNFRPEHVAAGFPWTDRPHAGARQRRDASGSGLAAWSPDWKQRIHQMRMRIAKERTPPGQDELAIKTGRGGLMDAEFVAQTFCLEQGWREPNTLRALCRARDTGWLPNGERLIENYRRLRRVEGVLRRWSYEGESVLPADPAPYRRVSVRCGFETPEAFRTALAHWRGAIREVYEQVFGLASGDLPPDRSAAGSGPCPASDQPG